MRFRWIKTTLMGTALVLAPISLSNSFAIAISNGHIADNDEKDCEDECEKDQEEENEEKKRPKKHAKKHKHKANGKKHKEHFEPGQQRPGSPRPFQGSYRGPQRDSTNHMPFSWQPENRSPQFRGPGGPPSFMFSPPLRRENQPNQQAEMIELLSSINRTLKNIESMMREEKNHTKPGERGMSGPPMLQGTHGPGQSWQPAQFVPQNGPPMNLHFPPQHGNNSYQPNNQQSIQPNLGPGQSLERSESGEYRIIERAPRQFDLPPQGRVENLPLDRGDRGPERRAPQLMRPAERSQENGPPRERPPMESSRSEREVPDRGPRPEGPRREDGRGPVIGDPSRSIEAAPSPSDSPR